MDAAEISKKLNNIRGCGLVGTIFHGVLSCAILSCFPIFLFVLNHSDVFLGIKGTGVLSSLLSLFGTFFYFAMAFAFILLGAAFIFYLIPFILGVRNQTKAKNMLSTNQLEFVRCFRADSIVKLVFNAIPTIVLLLSMAKNAASINRTAAGIFLLFAIMTGLAYYQLSLCRELKKVV